MICKKEAIVLLIFLLLFSISVPKVKKKALYKRKVCAQVGQLSRTLPLLQGEFQIGLIAIFTLNPWLLVPLLPFNDVRVLAALFIFPVI